VKPETAALLRKPFEGNQISTFPRNAGSKAGLSYIGHAALTDRLLQADPDWTWEPVANPESIGLPMAGNGVEMWIRLTIDGTTRYGYGDAPNKKGGDAIKEAIGDALRNAAMRFGVALDLWHKGGDLYREGQEQEQVETITTAQAETITTAQAETITPAQVETLLAELKSGGSDIGKFTVFIAKTLKVDCIDNIPANAYQDVLAIAKRATAAKAAKAGA